jgi:hypothetical protein
MEIGQTLSYTLPAFKDDENLPSMIYLDRMDGQENAFPDFLNYENATQTLTFRPKDPYLAGKTYFFTVIIKEINSDSVIFTYFMTVTLKGKPITRDTTVYWVDVNYTITAINSDSTGSLEFSEAVNNTYLASNFYNIFRIFWRDINYKTN